MALGDTALGSAVLGAEVLGLDVWSEFRPFGLWHGVVVLVCAGVMAGAALWGRSMGVGAERSLRRTIALTTLVWQGLINSWWMFLAPAGAGDPWPLHVCDIAALLGGVSMLPSMGGQRWMRTVLYFWGIALSTQAFVTPVLTVGLSSPAFWSFWVGHTQIVGIAVYHVVVGRYRPAWRDVRFVAGLSVGYAMLVTPMNIELETNYGYIGPSLPDKPTLVDALGPWPRRIYWMILIGLAAQVAAWVPWAVRARLVRGRAGGESGAGDVREAGAGV